MHNHDLPATEMFALSVTILEIFCRNVHDLDLVFYNEPKLNLNIQIKNAHVTSRSMAVLGSVRYHFRDIPVRNVPDVDRDLLSGPR